MSLIFCDWEPGQAAQQPFPHDVLAEASGYLEELDVVRGKMTQMKVAHDANTTSMKHFRTVSQRLVNKAQLESGRVMFRCWRMLTLRRKKALQDLSNRRRNRERRERMAAHFTQWKRCTAATKMAAMAASAAAAAAQVTELTKKMNTAVSAGRSEMEQELVVVKTKLYEEMELRETQLSAFTAEIDDLAVQLSVGRKLLSCISMERSLWRSLWLTHHRETSLPDKCAPVMLLENGRIQDSMRSLHLAESAYIEAQTNNTRRRSSGGVGTSVADVQAPSLTDAITTTTSPNPSASMAPSSIPSVNSFHGVTTVPSVTPLNPSSFDDSLPRMQRARFVLRQSVESLLTMWSNAVLSKLGSSRILLSLKDDLADGEIFAGLCYALERPAPTIEFVGNSLNPMVNAKTLLDTVKLCVQRAVACPGHQPLLTHCPYYADRLDENNILFSAGDDASSNWHVWLLATLFADYCWQQLCNVDESDGHIQLDDWNVLSCNTTRHKSAIGEGSGGSEGGTTGGGPATADPEELTSRMVVAEKVMRREKAASLPRRVGPPVRRSSHAGGAPGRSGSIVPLPSSKALTSGGPNRRESHRGSVAGPLVPSRSNLAASRPSVSAGGRRPSGQRAPSISEGPPVDGSNPGPEVASSIETAPSANGATTTAPRRTSVVFQSPMEEGETPPSTDPLEPLVQAVSRRPHKPRAPPRPSQPKAPTVSNDSDGSSSDVDDGFDDDDFITPANAALMRNSSAAIRSEPPPAADEELAAALDAPMGNCEAFFASIRRKEERKGAAHRASLYLRREFHPHPEDVLKERDALCAGDAELFSSLQERCRWEIGRKHRAAIAATYDACRAYELHKESVERKRAWHDLCQQVTQAIVVFRCLDAPQPASPTRLKAQQASPSFQF